MNEVGHQPVTAVVTGAGGFFGGHLVRELLAAGVSVRAFLRYRSDGNVGSLAKIRDEPGLSLWWGDVRDEATLKPVLSGADTVFHLASLVSVPHSYTDPTGYVMTNIVGTANLLREARSAGLRRIIAVSSSEVYGTAQTDLIDESHPLVAQSPYAATKIACEKLCESYFRTYETPVVVVRPFNLYGPGQSRRAVIPELVSQALLGTPVYIGARDTVRDFNFVGDTATAVVRLASAEQAIGHVYNIGTGRPTSINEIIAVLEGLLDRPLDVRTDSARIRPVASEVRRLCADSARLREVIGRWPQTDLVEGARVVVEAMRHDPAPAVGLL